MLVNLDDLFIYPSYKSCEFTNTILFSSHISIYICVKITPISLTYIFSIWFLNSFCRYTPSPGGNTPQDTNCTATCPLSRKLFKLGEPDMQDIAGEAEMNS